jgi:diaminopimelate epimerase
MQLTKHHGLANDFLVALDEVAGRALEVDGDLARRVCDRRTGLGADGLIHGARPGPDDPEGVDVVMHLFNADGSRAEMSGNGIRCLGQALAVARGWAVATSGGAGTGPGGGPPDEGLPGAELLVATDAGLRPLALAPGSEPGCVEVSVGMGAARPGPAVPGPLGEQLDGRHLTADLGNPHLVVEVPDPTLVDLASEGAWLEQQFAGGVNVEFMAVTAPDTLTLRVWERGAGITWACGTGACASAWAAHQWGLVGTTVRVEMAGGAATVALGPELVLTGPSCLVARVEVADA